MNVTEITLDIEKIAAQQVVGREWLKHLELRQAETGDDWFMDTITLQMVRQIASVGGESITIPEITVPATWWDAFKARYFADLLLRWFPVRYRTLQHERTYQAVELLPNVDLPESYRVGAIKVMSPR